MNGTVRIVSCVHRVLPGNPGANGAYARKAIEQASALQADLLILPALSLSGASAGALLDNRCLIRSCREILEELQAACRDFEGYLLLGLPVEQDGKAVPATAVIHQGELLGLVAETSEPSPDFLPPDTLFGLGEGCFAVSAAHPSALAARAQKALLAGADILVNPCAIPVGYATVEQCRSALQTLSQSFGIGVAVCNGNIGESTSPYVYRPFTGLFECGEPLSWQIHEQGAFYSAADVDFDIIRSRKVYPRQKEVFHSSPLGEKGELLRDVRQNPYFSADFKETVEQTAAIFELQIRGLAGRMKNAKIDKAVVGVSGGLDSTLALLVAAKTIERLKLPGENLIAVTMPGFGTTDETYYKSLKLMEELGASRREIPIKAAVSQHFEDIGHDPADHDVTYENAQARERTQILFDLANSEGALVVGTGDLSEIALGWCTFNGDQMSNYNVNAGLTKSMAASVVTYLAESGKFMSVADILTDIAQAPPSPELLPADESGRASQITENILGSYRLHDFYLYYFVRYGMAPSKIFQYAKTAFGSEFEETEIYRTLSLFLKRFFRNQFKRSAGSESLSIGPIDLGSKGFQMAADLDETFWQKELESYFTKTEE